MTPPPTSPSTTARRIVLYSHDTVGLGHLRRNLAIASSLVAGGREVDVLMISGTHGASNFPVPTGVDFLTLPGIAKRDTRYTPRSFGSSLAEVLALRAAIIRSAVAEFEPDVFVVDKVPRGVGGELDPTLEDLRRRGRTQCVLGLRDVLDDPATTSIEWREQRTDDAVARHYDAIWWYGDRRVFDAIEQYGLNGRTAAMSSFTGYLARHRPVISSGVAPEATEEPYMLCLVGGGEDGFAVADAFVSAPLGAGLRRLVVTGPFMPAEHRAHLERGSDVTVIDSVPDCADLIVAAHTVVSMGGYNTICELLAAGKHPLVVPRATPRREQLVRAQRLAGLGLVDVLVPDELDPDRLADRLARSAATSASPCSTLVDLDGLQRIPVLTDQLCGIADNSIRPDVQPGTSLIEEPHRATA